MLLFAPALVSAFLLDGRTRTIEENMFWIPLEISQTARRRGRTPTNRVRRQLASDHNLAAGLL
ncbi:hypothetical protein [Nocardia rhizosphaerihabitans]|uniref:Uncharacterized protein n=1 Tax=Nocardia rhizosphaerihabitans TaxID=1691570 RepID=A0ABQ2KEA6_9NOCA|nr:hypothetical protein [Nocardia rhizosphaerihabitans]GGN79898.1 hypothetical protein GCM10011610_28770 [Nocardia rhizosphaerihabitans]